MSVLLLCGSPVGGFGAGRADRRCSTLHLQETSRAATRGIRCGATTCSTSGRVPGGPSSRSFGRFRRQSPLICAVSTTYPLDDLGEVPDHVDPQGFLSSFVAAVLGFVTAVHQTMKYGVHKAPWFNNLVEKSFYRVDMDKDGALDLKELRIAILVLYDKINVVLPCRISPPSHAKVLARMELYDKDKDGKLCKEEYTQLCVNLFANKDRFQENVFLRMGIAIFCEVVTIPFVCFGIQSLLVKAGYATVAKYVPVTLLMLICRLVLKRQGVIN